ncbi:HlyD family efflux transporter periplasmic adaptor subunit [Paraclostridium sordellii]|uniref:HlyD family efflux transporter periplasmic adaptor subunit n=1 Tax=Paraclostridium sordellii TaxID=1505 RepID=UPI0005E98D3B|nr:HlyD family efflux transporter periplasmic adaptor subunit [Paeniclostridium sordellii]CEP43554.1 bacteriocin ABC transporter bacteriocin-binding protein [[Clostridium] sordellii] [Paeniclostridium sordellii]CEP50383.1 bacteriocin ABC transporter bacteriocin-binding protein [[Clostridium] sordellii] [Paeniclostridium sordellii]
MKFKIEDINNLSDSRQVLESKPNKFIIIFIYILLLLILMFFAWTWFSEKEVVAKVPGLVRPNSKVQTISNIVQGEVKSVKMKNGEKVSKGDILFEIDSDSLEKEKKRIEDQIDKINDDNNNLNKLNKSIVNNKNYFSNSGSEKEYYYKFKSYESGNNVSLAEKNNVANSKNDLNDERVNLERLNKSIIEETNYNEKDSAYSAQYESYMSSRQMIQNKIEQLNNSKNELSQQVESENKKIGEIPKDDTQQLELIKASIDEKNQQISQIDFEIKNSNEELEKLKNDTIAQIKGSIEKASQSIDTLEGNLKSLDESANINKDSNKTTILAQIEEKINLNKNSKIELETNKKQIEESLKKCVVKSPVNGRVNTLVDLQQGLVLQTGTIVANVIPNSNNYKIDLMIPTKDIANIEVDQNIKYSFEALPYREYGFLEGKIETISPDSKVDSKTGMSFFTGEGSLSSNVLYSNKGEESYIKPGMICEAKIITRNEKMMYYILEKIGLKNK